MDFADFYTGKNDENRRIDKVIRIFAGSLTLSEIYKYIRKGLIKVNSKKVKSDYKIQSNDVINIASFIVNSRFNDVDFREDKELQKNQMPEIVFENQHILIINKPYGVLVHGDSDSLDKIVQIYYKKKYSDNSLSFTPGPLHRIDKKTTGLLAFSMSLEGARWFSENIQNHIIQKKYFGLVQGEILHEELWIDEIKRNEDSINDKFHTVNINEGTSNDIDYKECITKIIPIQAGSYLGIPVTFVVFDIKTGRTHQIRAQSSLHKHPLLGDSAYGSKKITGFPQDFFLQAYALLFPEDNPLNMPCEIKINPNPNLMDVLKSCGITKFSL